MKKLFAASAGLAALFVSPALAADLPAKAPIYKAAAAPIFNWTGCYVGANIGGGWARKHIVDQEPGLEGVDRDRHNSSGVVGGGQIGCDYQVNSFVFGIQGMFDAADITGSGLDLANPLLTWTSKNEWFATVTGRVGFAVTPAALIYAKGGGAWVKDHSLLTFATGTQSTPDRTMNGWTVGGGLEYMFAPNWSVFAEYNYIWLQSNDRATFTRSTDGATFPYDVHNNLQTVLVGINYRFGGGAITARY
ncbi:porin family protein [Bradyrhizobium lablabi]|uniref:outer membrane protein n=1 Tax=Bradyrhizobium lablabi TaxID=722472 RepID=UPI001BAC8A17|nr:outer membrane beta-barrel protein [Bradyrhizobium lablabi]MBR1124012.1 porin family protein [Bradyrhizobium lablabi]